MIDRYLKGKEITIHDSLLGTRNIPYQDNIEELVTIHNDIEILNDALRELENSSFIVDDFISILKVLIYLLSGIFMSVLGSLNHLLFLRDFMPSIGIVLSALYAYKAKKTKNKKVKGLELQKEYILSEIAKKRSREKILVANKTHKEILLEEKIISLDTIAKKRNLLQSTLDLLMNYKEHEKYYRKNFDNHNLEKILQNEEDKRLIQDVIIREIRR